MNNQDTDQVFLSHNQDEIRINIHEHTLYFFRAPTIDFNEVIFQMMQDLFKAACIGIRGMMPSMGTVSVASARFAARETQLDRDALDVSEWNIHNPVFGQNNQIAIVG